MKKMMLLVLTAIVLTVCGCRTQIITVDVAPADATVLANGVEYRNKSPLFVETPTGKQLMITAYKEGYRDKIYAIDYKLSTVGKIETIAGCILLLPFIGLCFDNAWELKENNVYLTLEPISDEAKKEALEYAPWRPTDGKAGNSAAVDTTSDPKAREAFNEL